MDALRRDGDRVVPAGPKARRTRSQLIDAATKVFAEQGYQNTAVAQIAERAGVSLGTFYQYFRNRDEVLGAMVSDSLRQMETTTGPGWQVRDGVVGLERICGIYVATYTQAIDIARVWENVSQTEPDMITIRRDAARLITGQFAAELLRASKAGEIREMTKREALLTARALAGMADRLCFEVFVFDPPTPPATRDEVAALLANLWAGALGLTPTS
ncbi:MAG TPA: helix-turn-helix domain-containing protein [Acidimicrobiales bacterium]|nr:helix-turn-helix domain-containing protein [Acidimicrobiales bacterium]